MNTLEHWIDFSCIGQRFIVRLIFTLIKEFKFSLLEREAAKGSVLLED